MSASQKDWHKLLDVAQFCYNLHQSSATGKSPFELVNGWQPLAPHEVAIQRTGGRCPAAYRFARSRQEMVDEARDSLAKAQRRMKKYADKGRRDLEFSVGAKYAGWDTKVPLMSQTQDDEKTTQAQSTSWSQPPPSVYTGATLSSHAAARRSGYGEPRRAATYGY